MTGDLTADKTLNWTINPYLGDTGASDARNPIMTMKMKHQIACIAALLLTGLGPMACLGQRPVPGGPSSASVTSKEVRTAAAFAIETQQKALQQTGDPAGTKLELVAILKAEQQVVAGMKYRLLLRVKLNGTEKKAGAIVWWQAWRKPDPYRLKAWTWE